MAEGVDTSSYLKPAALPQQKSLLDQVGQFQQLESGKNVIEKQKLDLVNQRFTELSKGFVNLIADKDLNADKVKSYVDNQVKLGYIPPEMAQVTISQLPANGDANTIRKHLEQQLQHAQTTMEALNYNFGVNDTQTDQSTTYQGVRLPPNKGGGFVPATQQANQLPPGTPNVDSEGQKGYVGPAAAPGVRPSGMAVQPPTQPATPPDILPAGPINSPAIPGPSANFGGRVLSANVEPPNPPATVSSRIDAAFPQRVVTDLAPGVMDARGAVTAQSGKDFATDLARAKNFKQDLYPAETALQGIKELGTNEVGPGTPWFNDLKSAIITWLPNADKSTIDKVGTFQETRKYLTQIARSSGNTGTNDQLAAAFAGNPDITMSKAATENVLKSVIALRKMQHAQTILAENEGVKPEGYSKWVAKNQNNFDARAFGFDLMSNDAKQKLVTELKKDPKALSKFEYSLKFAHDADLIAPPARK